MAMPPLSSAKAATFVESPASVELALPQLLDVSSVTAVQNELATVLATARNVAVDLSAVERVDGAGLQLLVALKTYVEQAGGVFRLQASSSAVAQAVDVAGLGPFFAPAMAGTGS